MARRTTWRRLAGDWRASAPMRDLGGLLLGLLIGGAAAAETPPRATLVREALKIDATIDGRVHALEALAVYPPGDGPFPLALFTHGSPRGGPAAFPSVVPHGFVPQMEEFARRGYASVLVMRRGFGESGGPVAEFQNVCDGADHRLTTREGGKDMRAAVAVLRGHARLDMSNFIAVGYSTGGLAVLSMAREPVEGLAYVIAFAPTRGSRAPNDTCNPGALVAATEEIGRTSRVPTAWIYTANDTFANLALARRMHAAYAAGGGTAEFVELPAWGTDGHMLFSRAGIPEWRPVVDRLLNGAGLPNWAGLPSDPPWPDLAPPPGLSPAAQAGWAQFLRQSPHKAFAANGSGSWSFRSGMRSADAARAAALNACQSQRENCRFLAVDDKLLSSP
jgi:dienelactone hydrolase